MGINVVEISEMKNVEMQATTLIGAGKVRALLISLGAGKSLDPCKMNFPVLYYVIEGQGALLVAEEQASVKTGSLVVVSAGAVRRLAAHTLMRVLAVQSLE